LDKKLPERTHGFVYINEPGSTLMTFPVIGVDPDSLGRGGGIGVLKK